MTALYLDKELAKFFAAAWNEFCDNANDDLQELLEGTPFVKEYEVTEEDEKEERYPDWSEGDVILLLTDFGEAAIKLASEETSE